MSNVAIAIISFVFGVVAGGTIMLVVCVHSWLEILNRGDKK
jgi:hypothetical protein